MNKIIVHWGLSDAFTFTQSLLSTWTQSKTGRNSAVSQQYLTTYFPGTERVLVNGRSSQKVLRLPHMHAQTGWLLNLISRKPPFTRPLRKEVVFVLFFDPPTLQHLSGMWCLACMQWARLVLMDSRNAVLLSTIPEKWHKMDICLLKLLWRSRTNQLACGFFTQIGLALQQGLFIYPGQTNMYIMALTWFWGKKSCCKNYYPQEVGPKKHNIT